MTTFWRWHVTDHPNGAATKKACRCRPCPGANAGNGGAVYGLGLVGAAVYFWRRADSPAARGLALGKALVWPAILVYEALDAVRRKTDAQA